jgi:hypothetical protein
LLGYLFREGQAGERDLSAPHTAPRLIAAWDGPDGLEPPTTERGGRASGRLAETLTDAQWVDISTEYLHRIGLAPRGDERAVRWVAVRHADDHVHVVATLSRRDGRRVWPRNDFYRSREASLAVEARYGLRPTSPADRTGPRQATRAEQRRHAAEQQRRREAGRPPSPGLDRDVLRRRVRAAAGACSDLPGFLERVARGRDAGARAVQPAHPRRGHRLRRRASDRRP